MMSLHLSQMLPADVVLTISTRRMTLPTRTTRNFPPEEDGAGGLLSDLSAESPGSHSSPMKRGGEGVFKKPRTPRKKASDPSTPRKPRGRPRKTPVKTPTKGARKRRGSNSSSEDEEDAYMP